MSKQQFLVRLRKRLSRLPLDDKEERLAFYSEMIDDRIQEGLSEEEAVRAIGSVDDIASQILNEIPFSRLVKQKIKKSRTLRGWEIVLLVLGFPLWFPLSIAAFILIISLYIIMLSVLFSLCAVEVSLVASAIVGIAQGTVLTFTGNGLTGVAIFSISALSAGAAIFMSFACKYFSKGIVKSAKKMALGIKNLIVGKEKVQ